MKKILLAAAIILGGLSTMSAQEAMPEQGATQTEEAAPAEAAATTETTTANEDTKTQVGYTEITNEEVPMAVTEALLKAYPEAVLTKAYVNENKEYRLDIKAGDQEGSLFADEAGKWIQN